MSKGGLSTADLQRGAKRLNHASVAAESKSTKDDTDLEAISSLEQLYRRHGGDLDEIFAELKADPSKAKKPHHKPKDEHEFARQYLLGYYSILDQDVDEVSADTKSAHK